MAEARSVPIPVAERQQLLDLLSGFALFGILLANMAVFSGLRQRELRVG